jgi:hypothetical protein
MKKIQSLEERTHAMSGLAYFTKGTSKDAEQFTKAHDKAYAAHGKNVIKIDNEDGIHNQTMLGVHFRRWAEKP